MTAVHGARVESPKNPRVKALVRLQERRERERTGRTLVEGAREVARALGAGVRIDTAFVAPDLMRGEGPDVAAALADAGVETIELSPEAFARASRRQGPDGVMAVVRTPRRALADLVVPSDPLLLVVVGAEKPGNIGALARTADAAGVDAVVAVGGAGTDPWNPAAIRASMGSVFTVPVVPCRGAEARAWLASLGATLVATTPAGEFDLWDADLRGTVAIVVGPEHEGLDPDWLGAATTRVRVPMHGAADSLNVGVTGALLLYEAVRQRRGGAHGRGP